MSIKLKPRQYTIDTANITLSEAAQLYRDYLNNFLSVQCWAEHYLIDVYDMFNLKAVGKAAHEAGY